jgi:hypothetical protein
MWESDDEDVRQAHGTRKLCTHHHPALAKGQYHAETGPPSNLLQGFSQSTMETMSTISTATSFPPVGNINITDQSLPADGEEDFFNHQEDENDAEQLPPLQRIWDCPSGWKCLWCSDVFVPVHATRALYHVIRFKGGGIKPCKASITANYSARYQAMRDDGSSKSDSKKRGVEVVDDIVMM